MSVVDTIDTTTVSLNLVMVDEQTGQATITAQVDNEVTGSDLFIDLDNGQTITIEKGQTSGSISSVVESNTDQVAIVTTFGGNYEALDTSSVDHFVTITGLDGNGAEVIVDEDDLPDGTTPNLGALTKTGSFSFTAVDGADDVTIGTTALVTNGVYAGDGTEVTTAAYGTLTITGFSADTDAITGDLVGGTFNYSYTLDDNTLTHSTGNGENSIVESLTVTVRDNDGDFKSASFDIQVTDDVPLAGDIVKDVKADISINTNLQLVIDVSGSMDDSSGVGSMTRMQLQINSAIELLEQYEALGDVKVSVITFSSGASTLLSWGSADAAKDQIRSLTPDGWTNYDAALNMTWNNFEATDSDGNLLRIAEAPDVNLQNVIYFFSDGDPNRSELGGTEDNPNPAVIVDGTQVFGTGNGVSNTEEDYWKEFLDDNNINSFAIGVGSNTSSDDLNQIAYNGITGVDASAIVVEDLNELDAELSGTINVFPGDLIGETTTSGNVETSIGADQSGYISEITVDGVTYAYDQATGQSSTTGTGTSVGTFNSTSNTWSVTTATGGELMMDMDNGSYTYTTPTTQAIQAPLSELIGYTLMDADGDSGSATLTLNVDPDLSPLIVRDDLILTNQSAVAGLDAIAIPTWALLANDTGGDGVGMITSVSNSADGSAVLSGATVTFTEASASDDDGGSFIYTNTTGGDTDTANVVLDRLQAGSNILQGTYRNEILLGKDVETTLAPITWTESFTGQTYNAGGGDNWPVAWLELDDDELANSGDLFITTAGKLEFTGDRGPNSDGDATLTSGTLDIPAGMTTATLSFNWEKVVSNQNKDTSFQISSYNGSGWSGWSTLTSIDGNDADTGSFSTDISEYLAGSAIEIRIKSDGDMDNGEYVRIDDLNIVWSQTGDSMYGGDGNDVLLGLRGNDALFGGTGQDILAGGRGADQLTGGTGADRFLFLKGEGGSGTDLITDFEAGLDTIVIQAANISQVQVSTASIVSGSGSSTVREYTVTVGYSDATAADVFTIQLSNNKVLSDAGNTGTTALPNGIAIASSTATIDGVIVGATVYMDINRDGVMQEDELIGVSNQYGHIDYVIDIAKLDVNGDGQFTLGEARLVMNGGIDIDTGLSYDINLYGSVGSSVVSPLTSLLQTLLEDGYSLDEANSALVDGLGFTPGTSLSSLNPIASTSQVLLQNSAVMTLAVQLSELAAIKLGTDEAHASYPVFSAISTSLVTSSLDADLSDSDSTAATGADFSNSSLHTTIGNELGLADVMTPEVINFMVASQNALQHSIDSLAPEDDALAAISNVQQLTQGSYAEVLESVASGNLSSEALDTLSGLLDAYSNGSLELSDMAVFDQLLTAANEDSVISAEEFQEALASLPPSFVDQLAASSTLSADPDSPVVDDASDSLDTLDPADSSSDLVDQPSLDSLSDAIDGTVDTGTESAVDDGAVDSIYDDVNLVPLDTLIDDILADPSQLLADSSSSGSLDSSVTADDVVIGDDAIVQDEVADVSSLVTQLLDDQPVTDDDLAEYQHDITLVDPILDTTQDSLLDDPASGGMDSGLADSSLHDSSDDSHDLSQHDPLHSDVSLDDSGATHYVYDDPGVMG
ncbi:VWA domain-containing protein [Synechococcus sp. CCY9202]|uniref:VWA domain-containing protein n=1 Tax=Synechococcus sp. CCY9202 TaxID=174698 RepID=UPI002B2096FA|nr:VWA domain-containing protein [Synechococcus sp. CCY9202]MEA5423795.1 VWA domain-containing protein [Synechococcus sp. CCY9202]